MSSRRHDRSRHGFTMMELVVSLVGVSVLVAGLSSALFIALSASNPSVTSATATREADQVLSEILAELEFAESVTEQTPTAFAFTVPDRDADGFPETIRYAWTGSPGDPLTREYNGGTPVKVLLDVYEFQHDLPGSQGNLLGNPDMEAGTTDWEAIPGASMYSDSVTYHSGGRSIYTYRNTNNDESGIRQDVTGQIVSGTPYRIGAWMRKWAAAQPFEVKVQLHVMTSSGGDLLFAGPPVTIDNASFTWVGATVTPVWTDTLIAAWWEATGVANIQDIYVDDAIMRVDTSRQNVNISFQSGPETRSRIESGVLLRNSPL